MKVLLPYLKCIVPAVATTVAVIVQYLLTGEFDKTTVTIAVTGALTSILALVTPIDSTGDGTLNKIPTDRQVDVVPPKVEPSE